MGDDRRPNLAIAKRIYSNFIDRIHHTTRSRTFHKSIELLSINQNNSSCNLAIEISFLSSQIEILGGIGILVPPVSQAAAWGLLILFIAVFPANINMAVNAIDLPNIPDSDVFRWGRLPLQAVLIAWAWWYTKTDSLDDRVSLIPDRLVKSLTQDLN
jgi:uncharacterized membrane protein